MFKLAKDFQPREGYPALRPSVKPRPYGRRINRPWARWRRLPADQSARMVLWSPRPAASRYRSSRVIILL